MVVALLRERDHLEIEYLRLQVELDRYKKHYYRPRADQLQSADDLTQLLINLPTTRISELSACFPRSVETRSGRKNHEPAKTSFSSCVEHVVRITHAKVARNLRSSCDSLQKFLIQSADVVQDQRSRTNSTQCCLSRNE
jgi:hypothetical protein